MELLNTSDYQKAAMQCLDAETWDYLQGGSDDEVTLRTNQQAFERLWLRPRVLVNVQTCELHTTVQGTAISMPVLVAPMAPHNLVHHEGECASARVTSEAGTVLVVSTAASRTLEEIAQVSQSKLWLQLYIRTKREAQALVQRAEACGYGAIVLTVDMPQRGNRERDQRNHFDPSRLYAPNCEGQQLTFINSTLTWEILDWLHAITTLPIIVKGILTAEDAAMALKHGVQGIIVSNHGGRQLDGAIPTLVALPEVIKAVEDRCEVYLDGGIRRGSDVFKALAMGARAVFIGRPFLWGLAVQGETGAHQVLEILHAELARTMALTGCPVLQSIDCSLVRNPLFYG